MKKKLVVVAVITAMTSIFVFCKNDQDIDQPKNEVEIQADTVWRLLPYVVNLKDGIKNFAECPEYTNTPFPALPWSAKTKYAEGAIRSNEGNLFKCVNKGESSDTGPSQRISGIKDGTVTWDFLKTDKDIWKKNTVYETGSYITNQGYLYVATTSGESAPTGNGPNGDSHTIQDGSVVWASVKLKWIDALNGKSSNSGNSTEDPLDLVPYSIEAYTHYQVAAGSVFQYDVLYNNKTVNVSNPWMSVTVYDRSTGNEISDQPSPYLRALECKWVTQEEINTKYFSFICNCDKMVDVDIPWVASFGGKIPANSQFRLRGAYMKGFNIGAVVAGTGGWWDVSDCILIDNKQIQTTEVAGFGIRLEGETTGGSHRFTRIFISGSGEDAIWAAKATDRATSWLFAESAIHHRPETIMSGSHTDCIQFGKTPGNLRIKRVVMEHDLSVVRNSDGHQPIGAAIISHDDDTSSGTEDWEISDCIIVTNNQGTNFYGSSSGVGFQRNVFAVLQDPIINGPAYLHIFNKACSLTDCVNVSGGNSEYNVSLYPRVKPTLINCTEITGIVYP